MLFKTRGIVINYIRFKETSIIIKIYTEEFGLQTYIENGARSSKGKNKMALFQPLTLLDLVVYHREGGNIMRLSEIKCCDPLTDVPYNFVKSGIALFMSEVFNKALKEESSNESLFEFLYQSILYLDQQTEHYENFPIQFLLSFAQYLGFAPSEAREVFAQIEEFQLLDYAKEDEERFDKLIESPYHKHVPLTNGQRRRILEYVLLFYRLHVDNFGELRSVSVLREMLVG
ncbi:DNA repair protein RecO [Xanthocytophaga agilis]|uniref:DNA repair protein RecO n=1 Tax=Xanthocytophaga agilis TaxID=3048010 RepID=A0AAE3R6M3_9BACT|nr:DNA repair protein RecO [Xanthocytophaga agilis]MDJ1504576.1 DNA repair protein RecO [Xanthocytophaga agilis]